MKTLQYPLFTPAKIYSRGFTLVELIVVLVIVAVLISISIPVVASFSSPKETLRKEGRRVMKLMNEARQEAVGRKVRIDLRIDPVQNEIRAVESAAYRALMANYPDGLIDRDEVEWAQAMTNRFEKTVAFSDTIRLEAFSINQVELPSDEDDVFQRLEEPTELSDPKVETRAISFTHFGGSDGGGISLYYKETRLDIAADILTGRPKIVNRRVP
jgi:prepilin-type N-terminal cleavage/methylation domain-containing protein